MRFCPIWKKSFNIKHINCKTLVRFKPFYIFEYLHATSHCWPGLAWFLHLVWILDWYVHLHWPSRCTIHTLKSEYQKKILFKIYIDIKHWNLTKVNLVPNWSWRTFWWLPNFFIRMDLCINQVCCVFICHQNTIFENWIHLIIFTAVWSSTLLMWKIY